MLDFADRVIRRLLTPGTTREDTLLPDEFLMDQMPRDIESDAVRTRERLRASEPRVICAWGRLRSEDAPVRVDVYERDTEVAEPPERTERDESGVSQDDEATDACLRAGEDSFAPLPADAVADMKVTALHGDLHAESIGHVHT